MRALLARLGAVLAFTAGAAMAAPAGVDLSPVEPAKSDSGLPADWASKAVFAEILVRSYQDSNGDGIGDLNGLTARLDYLKDLGITALWLMPVFKSDDHDHGYAVVDYRAIEPDYGTLADFDRLIAEAHRRGIAVIVDYVMNHASSSHPLFEDAYDSRKSPYADWFIWEDKPPKGWNTFAGEPWREGNQRWYYGVFDAGMPDFNLRNPKVVDWHMDNLRYWLNRGVDGFRFDAVGVLVENSAVAWENQPENHPLLKRAQDLLGSYGKRWMVCEAPSDPAPFADPKSCGSAFAFGLHKHLMGSVKLGRVKPDMLYQLRTLPVPRMGTMLANHDGFAGTRLFQQFTGDEKSYRVAAASLLTLPGIPFLYYGEEIGLAHSAPTANLDQAIRGPMSWSGELNAGFTTAAKPYRPNVSNWQTHNVAAQKGKPESLLNWYRGLIALRHAEPALSVGGMTLLSKDDAPVLSFLREHDGRRLLVLINYAYKPADATLPAGFDRGSWKPVFPAGAALPAPVKNAAGVLRLAPQQVLVLRANSGG